VLESLPSFDGFSLLLSELSFSVPVVSVEPLLSLLELFCSDLLSSVGASAIIELSPPVLVAVVIVLLSCCDDSPLLLSDLQPASASDAHIADISIILFIIKLFLSA
jgi:hypothetical protein